MAAKRAARPVQQNPTDWAQKVNKERPRKRRPVTGKKARFNETIVVDTCREDSFLAQRKEAQLVKATGPIKGQASCWVVSQKAQLRAPIEVGKEDNVRLGEGSEREKERGKEKGKAQLKGDGESQTLRFLGCDQSVQPQFQGQTWAGPSTACWGDRNSDRESSEEIGGILVRNLECGRTEADHMTVKVREVRVWGSSTEGQNNDKEGSSYLATSEEGFDKETESGTATSDSCEFLSDTNLGFMQIGDQVQTEKAEWEYESEQTTPTQDQTLWEGNQIVEFGEEAEIVLLDCEPLATLPPDLERQRQKKALSCPDGYCAESKG
ncbi:hypothetical protein F0562_005834 [Nyssa sinensis]|uniref:Uncharacterized protein n=1 Tax=Nyssa sinensis TaxID=561372 RepID=A0A5J5AJA9_9ASTE|nr:hypothetical protein F0562_005834 [Nyssa sinensis]